MERPRLTLAPTPAPAQNISQCGHSVCEQIQSSEFWPYCSQSCAVKAAWEAVAAIQRSVDDLDMPLRELRTMRRILDGCPFAEDAEKLQQVIDGSLAIIRNSQRELVKSAVSFTHGATVFTDVLGPLIVGADDELKRAHPAWMRHPETWPVARDPKWQRDAMGGDFIQHWLSYHVFDADEGVILVVYRSTWLRDTDKMFEPVRELLADGFEVLSREVNEDKDMIFGHGELTIYALAEAKRMNPAADGTEA